MLGVEPTAEPVTESVDPKWYRQFGQFEPVNVVEAWGLGWHLGSVVSYIARAGHKTEDPLLDLKKARWFLDRHIKNLESARGEQA